VNNTEKLGHLDEDGETPRRKDAKPVAASLSEFLLENKTSTRRFVQFISKRPALTDDDLARSQGLIDSESAKIARVVELARSAAETVPPAGMLLRWCEQIVRTRDEALQNWSLDPSESAAGAFRKLVDWAYPLTRGKKDRVKRRTAEACVSIGLNVLVARRALSPLDALRELASASGALGDRRTSASLQRTIAKQLGRAAAKQLFDFARIVSLCNDEITAIEDACRRANGTADELRQQREALENERTILKAELQSLSSDIHRRNSRITELTADLEGAKVRAHQELDKLKARFRREIGERLGGLLGDAWDAIDTDPPHPTVARERLEVARELIQKEIEWLVSSD
jgi:hypothetical protein